MPPHATPPRYSSVASALLCSSSPVCKPWGSEMWPQHRLGCPAVPWGGGAPGPGSLAGGAAGSGGGWASTGRGQGAAGGEAAVFKISSLRRLYMSCQPPVECDSPGFSIFTKLCSRHHNQILEHFRHPRKKPCVPPQSVTPHPCLRGGVRWQRGGLSSVWPCVAVGAFPEVWPSSLAPRDPGPPFFFFF